MGIRFLCGHCQGRLNVKQRLAGEYCFCPDCSEEILVPLASTIEKSRQRSKRNGQRREIESAESGNDTATLERPDRMSGIGEVYAAGIGSNRIVDEVTASLRAVEASQKVAEEEAAEEAAFLVAETVERARPDIGSAAKPYDSGSDSDSETLGYFDPDSDDGPDAELETGPTNPSTRDNSLGDNSLGENPDQAPTRSFLLSKPVTKIENDPLSTNPKLVWYLRHRSLGEKGPLKAHQVETMLETGQLREGTILWREDWNDWLPVEQVFPQLVEKSTVPRYEIPDELNPHSEANRKRRARKRFWMGFNTAAFLLIIVLVYWLTQVIFN